jgi:D-threo-aldose 1-dehydrogenase
VGRILKSAEPQEKIDTAGFVGGGHFHRQFDYSSKGTHAAIEQSFAFMNEARRSQGLGEIDPQKNNIIAFVHDPGFHEHGKNYSRIIEQVFEEAYPALFELKRKGIIKGMGVATNEIGPCLHALNHAETDFILLAGRFTLLSNMAPEAPASIRSEAMGIYSLLQGARKRNIPIIMGGLANSGLAYGRPFYNYQKASDELLHFRMSIARVFEKYNVPINAGVVQFPLLFGEGVIQSSSFEN